MGSGKGRQKRVQSIGVLGRLSSSHSAFDQEDYLTSVKDKLDAKKLCRFFNLPKDLLTDNLSTPNNFDVNLEIFAGLMNRDSTGLNKWNNLMEQLSAKGKEAHFSIKAPLLRREKFVINITDKQSITDIYNMRRQLKLHNVSMHNVDIVTNGTDINLLNSSLRNTECNDTGYFLAAKNTSIENCNIKAQTIEVNDCSGSNNNFSSYLADPLDPKIISFHNNDLLDTKINDINSDHMMIQDNRLSNFTLENNNLNKLTSSGNKFNGDFSARNNNIKNMNVNSLKDVISSPLNKDDIETNIVEDTTGISLNTAFADGGYDLLKALNIIPLEKPSLSNKPLNNLTNF